MENTVLLEYHRNIRKISNDYTNAAIGLTIFNPKIFTP